MTQCATRIAPLATAAAANTRHHELPPSLVVAIAIGYDHDAFSLFVGSLRAHYSGDVLLYGSARTSSRVRVYCEQRRVTLRTDSEALGLNLTSKMRIMHTRFLLYAHACTRPRYSVCFASDFRDIFFQAHPFVPLAGFGSHPPDLLAPMEYNGTIGASPINKNWIRSCYGDKAALAVSPCSTVNDGAIFGTPEGFAALAERFGEAVRLDLAGRSRHYQHWVVCGDQGVFNHALHTRAGALRHLSHVAVQPRGRGIVNTLYQFRNSNPRDLHRQLLSSDGLVMNDDGSPSAVVHMWDRISAIVVRNMSTRNRFKKAPPLSAWEISRARKLDLKDIESAMDAVSNRHQHLH